MVNITPAQVVTRMAEPLLWDYVVTDFAYVQRMGGIHPDPTVVHGLPDWLTETVIPVPEIEAFKNSSSRWAWRKVSVAHWAAKTIPPLTPAANTPRRSPDLAQ